MEETYDKIRPMDISDVMTTFNKEYDGITTFSTYYETQQFCRKLLKNTKEPIQTPTIIRTSLGHFQRLSYIGKIL